MELTDRWAVRYYEWSCEHSEDEFRSGFPLLSTVLGASAWKLIEYAETLSALERSRLPSALVKRFNARALALIGHAIDPQETKLIDEYLNFSSEKRRVFYEQIDYGYAKRGNKRVIRKMVTKQLGNVIGEALLDPSGTVKYEMKANGWRLRTLIDYGGSYGQITYGHALIPDGLNPLFPTISLTRWMGVGGDTTWDAFTAGQEEEVAASIARLVSWFVERWIPLVDSL